MNRSAVKNSVSWALVSVLMGLIISAIGFASTAEDVRSIKDPNSRIVEEMKHGWVGQTASDIDDRRQSETNKLAQKANQEPEEVSFFHVLFNRGLDENETLNILGTFLYVDQIVFKQYEPNTNDVWTTSVSDFEMYKGTPEERLSYISQRAGFHALAATHNQPYDNAPTPPLNFDFAVYEIKGYAKYSVMAKSVEEHSPSLLHFQEQTTRIPYKALKESLGEYRSHLPIPMIGQPQASIGTAVDKVSKLLGDILDSLVPKAHAAYSPCGPGSSESYCPPDNTYPPTYADFNGFDILFFGTPLRYIQTIVRWDTESSQAAFKDTMAPLCRTPLGGDTSRCRTVPTHEIASNVVYVEDGPNHTAIEVKVLTRDDWCAIVPFRTGTWVDFTLYSCMWVYSHTSNMPASYDDYVGTDLRHDFIASVGTLAPHLISTGATYSNYSYFLKPDFTLAGKVSSQSVSINADHFGTGSPVYSILIVDLSGTLRQRQWFPFPSNPYSRTPW